MRTHRPFAPGTTGRSRTDTALRPPGCSTSNCRPTGVVPPRRRAGLHQVGQHELPLRRARMRPAAAERLPGGDEHRGGVLAVLADRAAALAPPPGIGPVVHRCGLVDAPLAADHDGADLAVEPE